MKGQKGFQKGHPKYKGREPGTPNDPEKAAKKASFSVSAQKLIDYYFKDGMFQEDFLALEPMQRFNVIEKFAHFVAPTMSATSVSTMDEDTRLSIIDSLAALGGDGE